MIRKTTTLTLFFLFCLLRTFAQSANFTAATTAGCSPLVVNFQDLSTGNPTSWFWDFGNGGTATLQNPSATYFTPGTYTVKLTVTNAQGSNTLTRTQYITVYGKPGVNFIVNDSTACFPHRAQFTDLSTASPGTTNTSWLWDFGDGTQSTQKNPLHTYTSSGNYTVTLKVTNDKGCYAVFTKQAYIIVAGGVVSAFSNTTPNTCSLPLNISFTNTSSGPGTLNWTWNFGDGNTSNQQNPVHTYTSPGAYTVTLATASSNGCIDTLRKDTLIVIKDIKSSFSAPDSICVNNAVNFLNTSNPPPDSSYWDFGDGSTSGVRNPVKSFTTPNTVYTVALYNIYGYCQDTVRKNIKILPRPVASFTSDVNSRCQPNLDVNFQDQSSGAVSWSWDFGDGGTSTQQNPSHTYTAYGNFNVRLVVTNSLGCTDTLTRMAFIRIQRPAIDILPLPVKGCIPYTLNPSAAISTVDNVTSYAWDFGDGNTSTLPGPSNLYTNQGNYTVSLTITTSTGCTQTVTMTDGVKAGRKPIVNFSASPREACAFQTVQFTDLTNEADEWLWELGDGTTTTLQHPTHQYSDTGWQQVTLWATNNGCRDSLSILNYVKIKPPIAKFGYQTTCLNRLQFNFLDSSIGASSWFWDFGDGTTSTAKDPIHFYSAYNTYMVSLTVTNDTCSNTITKPVRVFREAPDFAATFTSACRRTTFFFNGIVSNAANITEFLWDFGDGSPQWSSIAFNSGATAYHYYPNSGYYTVTLITTDLYGCKDTTIKTNYIRVNGPLAAFNANIRSGCKGLNTVFDDQSQNDGISPIVNWKWDFGDGTVQNFSSGPFQHIYNTIDTFTVKLTVTDAGGCVDSLALTNFVTTTNPKANFIALDTFACPGSIVRFRDSSVANNFTSMWYFGDGNTSTMKEPTNQFSAVGNYTVKLVITDQAGCRDSLIRPNYIRVNRPVASYTVNDSVSSCTPFEVQFTNTSQYTLFSQWNLGIGVSTLYNPVAFYNAPGTYNIQMISRSPGGCEDTTYGIIRVFDTAGSRVSYLPLDGCKPLTVDLSAYSPGPMDQYTWDFGDGVLVTETDTASTHLYNFFGNFVPKVILTDPAGCIIPITGIDTIRIKGATVKFGLDKRLFCDSGLIQFTDSTLYNDSVSVYNWNFGDGSTSNLQHPSHYYSSPGYYSVSLNVQTQNACVDTFMITNAVKVVESPLIRIGGDSVICLNDFMVHLGEFQRPDTSVIKWSWKFPNGKTSALEDPERQQYGTAGTFQVQTIATDSDGCKDTATRSILVNPLPTATLPSTMTMQAGFPIQIPATYTSNVVSYNWTPPATLSCADCPEPIAAPKFNTKYTVAFVDSNGCRNTAQVEVIVICKNANVFVPNTFSPNGDGSNDVFYVRGKGLDRVKSIRIFNRWGEVVFEQQQFPVNDPSYGWNGKYKGNKPIPDVYVYQVEVFCDNSQIIRFEGNIALIQ